MKIAFFQILICTLFLVPLFSTAQTNISPTRERSLIANGAEWENDRPVSLPNVKRPKVESVVIYQPTTEWTYSHHQSITFFKGRFYAIWSSGRQDEDVPGQRVLMASAADFKKWTAPRPLVDSVKDDQGVERVLTAAGFHHHEGTLVAYFGNCRPKKETTQLQAVTTTDGGHWSAVCEMGVPVNPNHGPQRTASGRLIIAGSISFPYTDDPAGLAGWKMVGIYPQSMAETIKDDPVSYKEVARCQGWSVDLCEGSFYQTEDGVLHMLLRNTAKVSARRLWLTESRDNGATWSTLVETEFSDTSAKFHFGRLPDGRFYYIGNPIGGGRTPLVLSCSRDGVKFDQHYILGDTHYERRKPGRNKTGQYGYPHSLTHDGHLYVIVSRQKEAVEVLRVALAELEEEPDCFDADYIRSTLIKVSEWQLQHLPPRHQPLGAPNGVFHTGLIAAYQATGNAGLLKAVLDMGEANQWKPGPKLMFPDHHSILNPYIELFHLRKEPRMMEPARQFADAYLKSPVNDTHNKLITWWLCDYVFMDAPVFIKLAQDLQRPALLTKTDALWRECFDLLFDAKEDLFDVSPKNTIYKGFNGPNPGEREANGEKIFWGCGNGWVLGGLALMLKDLPADHKARPHYEDVFKRMARRLAALQHADGTWGASLLDPQSYPNPESTGSSLITFGVAYGINAGLLPRAEFDPVLKKAWTGLCTICLQPDSRIGWSEGSTAKPIRTYDHDSYHLFSTGAFLLAGSEVSKWRTAPPNTKD